MPELARIETLVDPPWELQPGETPTQFSYFVLYRDLGEKRSLQAVATMSKKSFALMNALSSARRWVERTALWDEALAHAQTEKSFQQELRERERRRKHRLKMAHKLISKADTIMDCAEIKPFRVLDEPNRICEGMPPKQAQALMKNVAVMMKVGMEAQRLEEGLATEIQAHVGYELLTILKFAEAQLTPEEYAKLLRVIDSIVGEAERPQSVLARGGP
ncbi:MAG: hypothetical protein ACYDCO_16030 [Armatimonadota bacterium]